MRHAPDMGASEVRTQIYLPKKLHAALRKAARARGVSMAQYLRDAAEQSLRRETTPKDPFEGLVGAIEGAPPDLAENHDVYLYGTSRGRE